MILQRLSSKLLLIGAVFLVAAVLAVVIAPKAITSAQDSATDWQTIAEQRGLTEADMRAAAMTYTPSGVMDEYVMFASGGHSGQMFVIGMPSMRLLRTIAVFTPEPWQGYGYGAGEEVLAGGDINGRQVRWGDTHHPALS